MPGGPIFQAFHSPVTWRFSGRVLAQVDPCQKWVSGPGDQGWTRQLTSMACELLKPIFDSESDGHVRQRGLLMDVGNARPLAAASCCNACWPPHFESLSAVKDQQVTVPFAFYSCPTSPRSVNDSSQEEMDLCVISTLQSHEPLKRPFTPYRIFQLARQRPGTM